MSPSNVGVPPLPFPPSSLAGSGNPFSPNPLLSSGAMTNHTPTHSMTSPPPTSRPFDLPQESSLVARGREPSAHEEEARSAPSQKEEMSTPPTPPPNQGFEHPRFGLGVPPPLVKDHQSHSNEGAANENNEQS